MLLRISFLSLVLTIVSYAQDILPLSAESEAFWNSQASLGSGLQIDPVEGNLIDLEELKVGQDDQLVYFYLKTVTATPLTTNFALFLDVDGRADTGYQGFSHGSDYLIQGTNFYVYSGQNGEWGWTPLVPPVVRAGERSFQFSVERSALGSPTEIEFVFYGSNQSTGGTQDEGVPAAQFTDGSTLTYTLVNPIDDLVSNLLVDDVFGPPPGDDVSRHTGPWISEDGAKDFLRSLPPVYAGAREGGDIRTVTLNTDGGEIPTGGRVSPLFGAQAFEQQMLRFEEFGTESMLGTTAHGDTLPQPAGANGFPDGQALDGFLSRSGFSNLPTQLSNTEDLNPWQAAAEAFLGRPLETPPAEGRPPGMGWAHQRWNEFQPEVYFKTVQTGARLNNGMRDARQRHGYNAGEFAPGGLYHTVAANDTEGAILQGTTQGLEVRCHPNFPIHGPTKLWTFDGTFPPKLLIGRYGEPILMRHYNALPIDPATNGGFGIHTISTHEHNGHNPAESDGFAGSFYFPGQYWDYRWPMILAGYDTVNTTASDPRAAFPAEPGEQIYVNDQNPGLRSEQNGRIQIRGDWRETMSTHWFHDHMIDHTAENVYKGNAAMFNYYSALDRGNEAIDDGVNLRFPSGSALNWGNRDYDVNLVIADKAWDDEGQLWFNPFDRDGFLADRMMVNWLWKPYFNVRQRSYRFRILNGAVARYMKLALVKAVAGNGGEFSGTPQSGISYDRVGFHMIANDGNIMEHAIPFDGSLDLDNNGNANEHRGMLPTIAIGERYDIIVDFASQGINSGDKLYLVNVLEHSDGRGPDDAIPLGNVLSGAYQATQTGNVWTSGDPAVEKILEFRVVAYAGQDLSMNPADYEPGGAKMIPLPIDRNNLGNPRRRTFEFVRSAGTDEAPWTVKTDGGPGLTADTRRTSAAPQMAVGPTTAGFDGTNAAGYDDLSTLEIWTLDGGGGWAHPVHIHFEEGVILSVDGQRPPEWEWWARKDIYRIGDAPDTGSEVVVALRFREFAGTYMEHCHNTTHEDHAMLIRWDLEFPGQTKLMPSPIPSWDGVSYVDTVALPTFRSGANGGAQPAGSPFSPPVIDAFTASPSSIASGGSTTLSWSLNEVSLDNVIALEITPDVGSVLGRFSATVSPSQDTTYTLQAVNSSGTTTAQATVTIGAGPAVDLIDNLVAPSLVQTGQTNVPVSIDYEATTERVLAVWLHDSLNGWQTVAQGSVTVQPGIGTHTFDLAVDPGARVGDGYVWAMRMLPLGGTTAGDALDARYADATMESGGVLTDALGEIALPTTVLSPDTVTLSVPYSASTDREIYVYLHDSLNGWATIGSGSMAVTAGTGTQLFSIPIEANARTGSGYLWAIRLMPVGGGTVDDAFDAAYGDVTVETNGGGGPTQDAFTQVVAPASAQAGSTVSVVIDYEATAARELGIWLHDSNDNWRTVGQSYVTVPPGIQQQSFNVPILADARVGDGYVWAIRLIPEGLTSDDALDAFYADATVTASGGGGGTQDAFAQVTASATVSAGATTQVVIDYEATTAREIGIWLHDSTDSWRTIGSASVQVPAGTSQLSLDIDMAADARSGDGHVWAIRLLPEGWATADDALDAFYQDVTVE